MTKTLKTLLTKLKWRRKFRSAAARVGGNAVPEEELVQQDPVVSEQMATLTLSTPPEALAIQDDTRPTPYKFGHLNDFEFIFKPDVGKAWPGPPYDEQSLFAPGAYHKARPSKPRSKQKCSKRKLSQEGTQLAVRAKERPPNHKHLQDVPRSKAQRRPVQYYGRPPKRDPPLHLLSLPGEIRNHIYRMLCVSEDPVIAQFRPIIKPRSGHGEHTKPIETTRRFPREPTLALGCRQLQKEVLFIFYSENKFVFRQSDDDRFKNLIMTRPEMIRKWTPGFEVASSLTQVEVHFNVRLLIGGKETIVYSLRKLADGRVKVFSGAAELGSYCTCFDKRVLELSKADMESDASLRKLTECAVRLVLLRTAELRTDARFTDNGSRFRPVQLKCLTCDLDTLRMIESGM